MSNKCVYLLTSPKIKLIGLLSERLPNINFIDVSSLTVENERVEALAEAEIILGEPKLISMYLNNMPRLKWCMSTWAGVDDIIKTMDLNKGLPSFFLTRSSCYGKGMAEYVICHILAHERQFEKMRKFQSEKYWSREFMHYRSLTNLTIGIVGMKTIGKEVAKSCKHFGMKIHGLVNTPIPKEMQLAYVDKYHFGLTSLPDMLSECDYVCNLLPSNQKTNNCLSNDILSACSEKQSVFINVGRGNVVDEKDIIKALNEKWINHAILDVFQEEPIPNGSELWNRPDVTITFHCATYIDEPIVADDFHRNYLKFINGAEMEFLFDWNKGY